MRLCQNLFIVSVSRRSTASFKQEDSLKRSVYWQIRYIGQEKIAVSVKKTAYGYRVQNLDVLIRSQTKQIKNWNIKIIQTE